jgi:hypothetical protein
MIGPDECKLNETKNEIDLSRGHHWPEGVQGLDLPPFKEQSYHALTKQDTAHWPRT